MHQSKQLKFLKSLRDTGVKSAVLGGNGEICQVEFWELTDDERVARYASELTNQERAAFEMMDKEARRKFMEAKKESAFYYSS